MLPSFEGDYRDSCPISPKIYLLEVKHKERLTDPAIDWLFVEREEINHRYDQTGSVKEASIRLYFSEITAYYNLRSSPQGSFRATCSDNEVSLTGGAVFLDLPKLYGQYVGTYLMNEIIK